MERSGSLHNRDDGRARTQAGGENRENNVPDPSAAERSRRTSGFKQCDTGTHRLGHPPEHRRLRALDSGKAGPTNRRTRRQENKEKERGTGKSTVVTSKCSERSSTSQTSNEMKSIQTHLECEDIDKRRRGRITTRPGNTKYGVQKGKLTKG